MIYNRSFLLLSVIATTIYFVLCHIKMINIQKKRKKIIDCFSYYQESLMLSIRLYRMNKYVDLFIIIIANETYSGLPLNISFSPFESFIYKYKKKIVYYNFTFPKSMTKPRKRENYQRIVTANALKYYHIYNDTIVIVSDLDEIPTSAAMQYINVHPPKKMYILKGYFYYYNYRHKFPTDWVGAIVIKAQFCKNDIQYYRDSRYSLSNNYSIPIIPSLTHCSYCYNSVSSIQKKLKSFAHTEYNKPPYIYREYIINSIKNHSDIFRNSRIVVVEYDDKLLPLPLDKRFDYLKKEFCLF